MQAGKASQPVAQLDRLLGRLLQFVPHQESMVGRESRDNNTFLSFIIEFRMVIGLELVSLMLKAVVQLSEL